MTDIKCHYINGRWCPPTTADRIPVIDPATHLVVGSAPAGGANDVDAAVAAARSAFPGWAATRRAERARLLGALGRLLRSRAGELARLIETEMGAPGAFALSEHVGTPIAIIDDYVAGLAHEPDEERIGNSLVSREPIGVVAAILPWNYPLYQLVAKIVPALAAGCTVVAKPAELTPLASCRFTELLDEVGFPAGVFNLVFGTGPVVGDALTSPPAEAGRFFPRGLSFLLLRQQLPRTNGKGRAYAQQSYTSSTDLTSRQPGGRPGQLGHRRPDATQTTTYLQVVGGERRSALAAHRLSLPCSAGVRFLPRLKAGVSTEESR